MNELLLKSIEKAAADPRLRRLSGTSKAAKELSAQLGRSLSSITGRRVGIQDEGLAAVLTPFLEAEERVQSSKSLRQARRDMIDKLKKGPCIDCKKFFPPVCMDFDHVRGKKVANISQMLLWPEEKILDELDKCEVVCACCHRLRTQRRSREKKIARELKKSRKTGVPRATSDG